MWPRTPAFTKKRSSERQEVKLPPISSITPYLPKGRGCPHGKTVLTCDPCSLQLLVQYVEENIDGMPYQPIRGS